MARAGSVHSRLCFHSNTKFRMLVSAHLTAKIPLILVMMLI
jgi:hypothetical protein